LLASTDASVCFYAIVNEGGNFMSSLTFTIRTMTHNEINIAIDWAAINGWNPGLYDVDSFYAAGPNGYFIGELNNEPIATLSAVKYGLIYLHWFQISKYSFGV
jgi:hypothetical protein